MHFCSTGSASTCFQIAMLVSGVPGPPWSPNDVGFKEGLKYSWPPQNSQRRILTVTQLVFFSFGEWQSNVSKPSVTLVSMVKPLPVIPLVNKSFV
jgi:hypothetical protein